MKKLLRSAALGIFLASATMSGAEQAAGPVAQPVATPTPAAATPTRVVKPTAKPAPKRGGIVNPGRAAAKTDSSEVRRKFSHNYAIDEARNLLVPGQKYWLKFEDEENMGRVASENENGKNISFSESDVEKFRAAVQRVGDYRSYVRNRCQGASNRNLAAAIDRYVDGLAAFNRRGLPLVADITESNNQMVLVVNRTLLTDAPVLLSRYLRFKRQRFKESLNRFINTDEDLIQSMVSIAKTLEVEIADEDWNRSYGIRQAGLESISLWPRESIFEATERLAEAKETACIVTPVTTTVAKPASPQVTGE